MPYAPPPEYPYQDLPSTATPVRAAALNAMVARLLETATDLPEAGSSAVTTAVSPTSNLLSKITRFNTTAAINQTLPPATAGAVFAVSWDAGTAALKLVAAGSDVIGSGSTTSAVVLLAGEVLTYHCTTAGRWQPVSGFKPQSALDSRYLAATIYDEFDRLPNGSLAGVVPLVGAAWLTSGAQGVDVASGYAGSTGNGYLYAAGNPDVLVCDIKFAGTASTMTMAWSSSVTFDLLNLLHLNFGPLNYLLTVRQDGGSFDTLLTGNWETPLKGDGTVYRFVVALDGNRVTILAPNGNVVATVADPRVGATRGNWVFWQPTTSGADSAKLARVAARSVSAGTQGTTLHPQQIGSVAAAIRPDRLAGASNKRHEVQIGREDTSAMPGVRFGTDTVLTTLSGAHSIGASSIVTVSPIPNASSVKIESGSGTETVTTNASSTGTGPYTSSISTTLTKAHADGVAAIATTPASAKTYLYFHTDNSWFYLPNAVVICRQSLYFGDGVDLSIQRDSAGVLGVGGGGAGKGSVKTGQAATASRPAATTVGNGAQFYDTTLNKPIWSDGTNWKDAAGNTV